MRITIDLYPDSLTSKSCTLPTIYYDVAIGTFFDLHCMEENDDTFGSTCTGLGGIMTKAFRRSYTTQKSSFNQAFSETLSDKPQKIDLQAEDTLLYGYWQIFFTDNTITECGFVEIAHPCDGQYTNIDYPQGTSLRSRLLNIPPDTYTYQNLNIDDVYIDEGKFFVNSGFLNCDRGKYSY